MATIQILEGLPVGRRDYHVSEENVSPTLRTLIKGAEDYRDGRLLVRVVGPTPAATLRAMELRRREIAEG
jgi:hypothetical protein